MPNSSNAYATLQPIQANVSDFINQQEQNAFAYRKEQRDIDAIEQDRKDKEALELEKKRAKFKPISIESTGIKSVDQVNAEILLKAVDKWGELDKQLSQAKTPKEQADIAVKLTKLGSLPDYLKLSYDSFSNEAATIKKQLDSGQIKATPEILSKLNSFSQGYFDVELDDDMTPMVGLWDKNGDGKPDVIPYNKMISGQTFGELVPNVDFSSHFMGIGKNIASYKTQTDSNFVKNTKQYTPEELNKLAARNELYLENGSLSSAAKSYLYDKGIRDFSNVPEPLLRVMENDAVNSMRIVQKKENVTDVDYGASETKKQNAIENARKRREEKAKELKITTTNVENTYFGNDSFGGKTVSKKGVLKNGLNLGNGIKFETIGGAKTGLDNSTVTNLFLNSEGKIIYTANVLDSKSSKEESADYSGSSTTPPKYRSETREATGATEAKLASALGYDNSDDLKKYLQELNPKDNNSKSNVIQFDSEGNIID